MTSVLTMEQLKNLFKTFEEHNEDHSINNLTEFIEEIELIIESENIPEDLDTYTFLLLYILTYSDF